MKNLSNRERRILVGIKSFMEEYKIKEIKDRDVENSKYVILTGDKLFLGTKE